RQDRFALSAEVLDDVIAELKKLSELHAEDVEFAASVIDLYRRLDPEELELVGIAAVFEQMTVREIAMALAFGEARQDDAFPNPDPAAVDRWERDVNRLLDRLKALGLAERSEGRFEF